MQSVELKKDLFNKNGTLLLAKGNKILMSDENVLKFNDLGILNQIIEATNIKMGLKKINDANDVKSALPIEDYSIQIEKSKTEIYEKLNINKKYEKLFIKSSELVKDLIYNNRNKKWYKHFITLSNYVQWLYTHSINTALISSIIGTAMEFNENEIKQLALGALLHDLGLILLPKKILIKPFKLNNFEMKIVKSHCELGYSMLEECELSNISKNIILQHHENIDGTGYPNGLLSDDISIESKVVMVAESFDTATTARPYQKGKSVNIVIEEMLNATNIYDEGIVNVLAKFLLEN